ncbi:MAG: hypothetical protein JXK94_13210 [Deltaproteobacteria bacterium]|nr:hypothetical protein [Deltaproteobacteria bacterium]
MSDDKPDKNGEAQPPKDQAPPPQWDVSTHSEDGSHTTEFEIEIEKSIPKKK